MGLDNGVNLKVKDKEAFGKMPKWLRREEWEDKYDYDYEMLYWRKCWNVREEVYHLMRKYYGRLDDDQYEFQLDVDMLKDLFKVLRKMYRKKMWDNDYEDGMTIWSWSTVRRDYLSSLRYAKRVARWLKTKPADSFEVYFYDSY